MTFQSTLACHMSSFTTTYTLIIPHSRSRPPTHLPKNDGQSQNDFPSTMQIFNLSARRDVKEDAGALAFFTSVPVFKHGSEVGILAEEAAGIIAQPEIFPWQPVNPSSMDICKIKSRTEPWGNGRKTLPAFGRRKLSVNVFSRVAITAGGRLDGERGLV